jgi:hypothetical protein
LRATVDGALVRKREAMTSVTLDVKIDVAAIVRWLLLFLIVLLK